MADVLGVDSHQVVAVRGSRVAALGGVLLRGLGVLGVVREDAGPLLDGLLVVRRRERGVGAPVVDLHPGPGPVVLGVHVLDHLRPVLRGRRRLPGGAGRVPRVHAARRRHEAPGRHAGVHDARCEDLGVRGSEDILGWDR